MQVPVPVRVFSLLVKDLVRPLGGVVGAWGDAVTVAALLGGVGLVAAIEEHRLEIVIGLVLFFVLVTAFRLRYELGVNRPHLYLRHFHETYPNMPYSMQNTIELVDESGAVLGEQHFRGVLKVYIVKAGIRNEPLGLSPQAVVKGATALVDFFSIDGQHLIGPLEAQWANNPSLLSLGRGEDSSKLLGRELLPSRTETHWVDIAVKPEGEEYAYAACLSLYSFGPLRPGELLRFHDHYKLEIDQFKVHLRISGPGMTEDFEAWLKVNNVDPHLEIRQLTDQETNS